MSTSLPKPFQSDVPGRPERTGDPGLIFLAYLGALLAHVGICVGLAASGITLDIFYVILVGSAIPLLEALHLMIAVPERRYRVAFWLGLLTGGVLLGLLAWWIQGTASPERSLGWLVAPLVFILPFLAVYGFALLVAHVASDPVEWRNEHWIDGIGSRR